MIVKKFSELLNSSSLSALQKKTFEQHFERLQNWLKEKKTQTFQVVDTCRKGNRFIHTLSPIKKDIPLKIQGIGFVPAAGAASRYLAPLVEVLKKIEIDFSTGKIKAAPSVEECQKLLAYPLPPALEKVLSLLVTQKAPSEDIFLQAQAECRLPKALLPANAKKDSYLALKQQEHQALPNIMGEVFIAPIGFKEKFELQATKPVLVFEQDQNMATLRFDQNLDVVCNDQGEPAYVAAGHGALVYTFPYIKEYFPTADFLFIRNIDNVVGCDEATISETTSFFKFFESILLQVRQLRADLKNAKHDDDPVVAKAYELQKNFFNTPDTLNLKNISSQKKLLERPVVLMGQVPNSGADIGGTPVLCKTEQGLVKVCLEFPHFSEKDQENWAKNPEKATHFNPVFVACELLSQVELYAQMTYPFWLISQKSFEGKTVYYHETILYEVLGNNITMNIAFVEISRKLFQPRKTISDTIKIS